MTPGQRAAQQQVDALLVKASLASSKSNSGFQCFLGSGSQQPYDRDDQEFRVELAAHRAVYNIVDHSSIKLFFTAVELKSEAQITRVVVSRRQRTLEKLRATPEFQRLLMIDSPAPLVEIEPVLIKLAEVVDARLAELNLEINVFNRIALLNLLWAYASNRIMYREEMDLGGGPIDYLRAGVDIEHILYAWSSSGWDYTRAKPALPVTDAAALKGIPLHRVRALYPQVTSLA